MEVTQHDSGLRLRWMYLPTCLSFVLRTRYKNADLSIHHVLRVNQSLYYIFFHELSHINPVSRYLTLAMTDLPIVRERGTRSIDRVATSRAMKNLLRRDWFQRFVGGLHVLVTMRLFTMKNSSCDSIPIRGSTGQATVPV